MPQITDLNVAPYYDDFDKDDNFHRVLFRPGFAIQARELTQLQSIMQNQIERFGRHMFQEGSVVIPGQVTYSDIVTNVQLQSTFAGETIDPKQYYNATTPVIITGNSSSATLTPSSTTETVTLANNNTLSLTTGYANPELQPDSGQIVYLENRKPIARASDQTEDIKLIIEF